MSKVRDLITGAFTSRASLDETTLQQLFAKGPASAYDVQRGKLWDTYIHPGGLLPRKIYMFCESLSSASLRYPDLPAMLLTNMQYPKRLPAPSAFAINTINFMFTEASLETELAFADSSSWTFYTGYKWYARSSLSMMQIGSYAELDVLRKCNYCERVHVQLSCPGCGSAQFSVLTSSAEQPLTSHRTKRTLYTHPMIAPHRVDSQIDFWIEFDSASISLPSFKLKCWFDGFHARGVQ